MSEDSPSPPESRPKLRLRADKTAGGTPLFPAESPAPARPDDLPHARPAPPAPSVPPAVLSEPVAASPIQAPPPTVRLKPRFTIKPAEPERPLETVSVPGLPPAMPPIGSTTSGPLGGIGEKVTIDLGPLTKPPEAALSAVAIPTAKPADGEKPEMTFKVKLKPALQGVPGMGPVAPAQPGQAEVEAKEVVITRPGTTIPSLTGAPAVKAAPAPAPEPRIHETPEQEKPARRQSPVMIFGLLAICAAGMLWFFFLREPSPPPKPVAAVKSHPVAAKAPKPARSEPAEGNAPAVVSPGETAATSTPAVVPAAPANTANPVPQPAPTSVNPPPPPPPPPPAPTPQFCAFVNHLKVNGVRTGPPARLFVDGLACRPGDTIDRSLGVVFVGVDDATKEIIFKDATGAEFRRRF